MISKALLRNFWEIYPETEQQLKAWYMEASRAQWQKPGDITKEYPGASCLQDSRVVFNIKGNKFRLIIKINYPHQMVWIRFVGTHSEYDIIDASKI